MNQFLVLQILSFNFIMFCTNAMPSDYSECFDSDGRVIAKGECGRIWMPDKAHISQEAEDSSIPSVEFGVRGLFDQMPTLTMRPPCPKGYKRVRSVYCKKILEVTLVALRETKKPHWVRTENMKNRDKNIFVIFISVPSTDRVHAFSVHCARPLKQEAGKKWSVCFTFHF